jgi:Tol biopolymer transport system component
MMRPIRTLAAVCAAVLTALLFSPAASATASDGLLVLDDFTTGQIYTVTQSGTNVTQLTHATGGSFALEARWSPNGRRIAFVIISNGLPRIYTMAADGSGQHKLRDDSPAWTNESPDYFPGGNRFVFSRCHTDNSGCVLATVALNGTGLRTLTSPGFEVYDVAATVSPDGSRIAFTRFNADGVHSRVWVMKADGSGAHPVTAPALEGISPAWHPNGTQLIVASNCCRLGGNVYRVPASGGARTQLTHTPYPNFSGAGVYAPSGSKIAFASNRNYPDRSGQDLFVMNANGTHQVKLNTGLTGVNLIDWAPSTAG